MSAPTPSPSSLPPPAPARTCFARDDDLVACSACHNVLCASAGDGGGKEQEELVPVRVMPCGHVVCSGCSDTNKSGSARCFVAGCGAVISGRCIDVGVAEYARQVYRASLPAVAAPALLCYICSVDEVDTPATHVCAGCFKGQDRALCAEHTHAHTRHAGYRPLSDARPTSLTCATHVDTPLKFLCLTDNCTVCAECALPGGSHAGHDVKPVAAAVAEVLSRLDAVMEACRSGAVDKAGGAVAVAAMRSAFDVHVSEQVQRYVDQVEVCMGELRAKRDAVLARVEAHHASVCKSLEAAENVLAVGAGEGTCCCTHVLHSSNALKC